MNMQHIQYIVNIIQHSPLILGGIGGFAGAFLTVAADCFINVDMNLKGWGRKILYTIAGAIVGMLFNYHTRSGMLYAAIVGSGWTVVVASFKTLAKTLAESIVKNYKSGRKKEQ
jgi:hypothetical protein